MMTLLLVFRSVQAVHREELGSNCAGLLRDPFTYQDASRRSM
jgi:hypothetical protein